MRGLVLCLLALTAASANAQTSPSPSPSRAALALGERAARGADPKLDQGLQTLVEGLANSYRANPQGQTVDDKALAAVTKSETAAARPLLWAGMARLYAETYTPQELNALVAYYRGHPGDIQNLPAPLAAKSAQIQARQRELVAQLGPRILQDFFGDYCSRAPCADAIRRAAGMPVKAAN